MKKRHLALLVTCLLMATTILPASATDITGVTGVDGVYNIDSNYGGYIGFRQYENFDLSNGDVANLRFRDGQLWFVNLVDNRINIDSILNTVDRNGSFYNGNAVFISPNGMTIGANGVLNVGSLAIHSPDQTSYNKLVENQSLDEYLNFKDKHDLGKDVIIGGKIVSSGDVDIKAGIVDTMAWSRIMLGVNPDKMETLTKQQAAEALFNKLVNTDGYKSGSEFNKEGSAYISIETKDSDNLHLSLNGTIKNFAEDASSGYINGFTIVDPGHNYGSWTNEDGTMGHMSFEFPKTSSATPEEDGMYNFTGWFNGVRYENGVAKSANGFVNGYFIEDGQHTNTYNKYSGVTHVGTTHSIVTGKWVPYLTNGDETSVFVGYSVSTLQPEFEDNPTENDADTGKVVTPTKPGKITKGELGKGVLNPNLADRLEKLTGQQIKADKVQIEKLNEALTNPNVTMKANQLTTGALQLNSASLNGLTRGVTLTPTGGSTFTVVTPGVVINPSTGGTTDGYSGGTTDGYSGGTTDGYNRKSGTRDGYVE